MAITYDSVSNTITVTGGYVTGTTENVSSTTTTTLFETALQSTYNGSAAIPKRQIWYTKTTKTLNGNAYSPYASISGYISGSSLVVTTTNGLPSGTLFYGQILSGAGVLFNNTITTVPTSFSFTASITGHIMTVTATNGTLAANKYLHAVQGGNSLLEQGTYIVAQLSGTAGGAGTYFVNISQTVSSNTLNVNLS